MAIARVVEGKGWTKEGYDRLIEAMDDRMGLEGYTAPGVLFHWVAETPDGIMATDVYQDRAAADSLAQEQIVPMPAIREYEVHAYRVAR